MLDRRLPWISVARKSLKMTINPTLSPLRVFRGVYIKAKIAACVDVFVSGGCELSSTDVDVNTF